MVLTIVLLILFAVNIALGIAVYENRAAEKIVVAFAAGLGATIVALFSVLFFSEDPSVHKIFSTVTFFNNTTHLPVGPELSSIPPFALAYGAELLKSTQASKSLAGC